MTTRRRPDDINSWYLNPELSTGRNLLLMIFLTNIRRNYYIDSSIGVVVIAPECKAEGRHILPRINIFSMRTNIFSESGY